ncbi:MAG: hypothetical protein GY725_15910 [bacterium]|nr:hypothetical protein [bacterium]
MFPFRFNIVFATLVAAAISAAPALADSNWSKGTYTVKITNLSKQVLTPPLVASHTKGFRIFRVGGVADEPLYTLAETGSPALLADDLEERGEVFDVVTGTGPILPGQSVTLEIYGSRSFPSVSVIGMLATTNDSFFAIQGKRLTRWKTTATAPVYDAGSEENNESCDYLPGPPCSGSSARMPDGAEGFIHRSNGIHGHGDLDPSVSDWRGDVASIEIYRQH